MVSGIAAQQTDTLRVQKDTLAPAAPVMVNQYEAAWQVLLSENKFVNTKGTPSAMPVKFKAVKTSDAFFYLLTGLVFILALLRFFFARYFSTLFRVFFNTSLRQSQLTDQLLQSKLPSLLFNAFFVMGGGIYIYFLLRHYQFIPVTEPWMLLGSCIVILGLTYLAKYSTLKFTGWVTGHAETTDTYVFIIFLICKIIGILLIPFIILMVFADAPVASAAALISLLLVGFLLMLRFFRSYGLLQNQLKISRFHFFLYIAGIEVIPLLLIYKGMLILLSKNL